MEILHKHPLFEFAFLPNFEADDTLPGNFGGNVLTGSTGADTILAGGGDDTVEGNGGPDVLIGGRGSDWMHGGNGNDTVIGGEGIDTLTGGAGDDIVRGGGGTDTLIYVAADNVGATDTYFGGPGSDTLMLDLTSAIWLDQAFQAELAAFLDMPTTPGLVGGGSFTFATLGLTIHGITSLNVTVDGTPVDTEDRPVDAVDDAFVVAHDDPTTTGNVLENDLIENYLAAIELSALPSYGTVTMANDGTFVFALDTTDPDVAELGQGEVLEDSFAYTIWDVDGDSDTATVTLNISGTEPAGGAFGFSVLGQSQAGFLGIALAGSGDINGDGIGDIVLGGDLDRATVIFGRDDGFPDVLDQTTLDGSTGFFMDNDANTLFGNSLSIIGDFNNDGFDDIVVSDKTEGAGRAYVVYGSDTAFPASFDVHDLGQGEGFALFNSAGKVNELGQTVSGAGDVNADGIDDLIVGSYYGDDSCFVLFGRSTATDGEFAAEFDLDTLDGTNGFRLFGQDGSQAGGFVTSAGDVNGDGIGDLLIGADEYEPAGSNDWSGAAYIVFGRSDGFDAEIDLDALDGSDGFSIQTGDRYQGIGWQVEGAGDVNGDGIDDVMIGTYDGSQVYVVFGRDTATIGEFDAVFDPGAMDGSDGFVVSGNAFSDPFWSIGVAGDVNGDGLGDILIGTYQSTYLIFGRADGFGGEIDVTAMSQADGYVFSHSETAAGVTSVTSAGDINGDGFIDIMIGRSDATVDGISEAGDVHVVYGGADTLADFDSADGLIDGWIDLSLLVSEPLPM